jgi:hypothetical protein
MAKRPDIPKTDPAELEALIEPLKQFNIEPRDAQLVERLMRLVLSMALLLQRKTLRHQSRPKQHKQHSVAATRAKSGKFICSTIVLTRRTSHMR